jgi:hypothetical protein
MVLVLYTVRITNLTLQNPVHGTIIRAVGMVGRGHISCNARWGGQDMPVTGVSHLGCYDEATRSTAPRRRSGRVGGGRLAG